MKTLVVGDLHLKQQFVLPRIDEMLAGDAEIGRIVFLGDACDDWGANEADELNAMEFYAKWVREHRGRGVRIDVLLGNHDFCYVRGKRGLARSCPSCAICERFWKMPCRQRSPVQLGRICARMRA